MKEPIILEYRFEDDYANEHDYEFYANDYEDEIIALGIKPEEYDYGNNYNRLWEYFYDRAYETFIEYERNKDYLDVTCVPKV